MNDFIELKRDEQEVNMMPPLTWAYVGDCVYELYIRTKLVNETKLKPHALHIEAIKHVKAQAQAETLKKIYDDLTEKEQDIVRRGRNAENHHLPKNANVQDYMYSTAFEALIGYLYLTKQNDRLKEILEKVQDKRTKCVVYTRVMGYHRPVESFNLGKKGEHKERIKFDEYASCCKR